MAKAKKTNKARPAPKTAKPGAKSKPAPASSKSTKPGPKSGPKPVQAPPKPGAQPAQASPKPAREKLRSVLPSGAAEDNFYELVHALARQIPRGRVTSYGAIAAALGTRRSSRMVGWALISAHHVTPAVPAHRVVNRTGLLTGRHHYSPPERMQQLLEAEGVKIKDNQVQDFDRLFWDPGKEM